jgi:hypothetical protein
MSSEATESYAVWDCSGLYQIVSFFLSRKRYINLDQKRIVPFPLWKNADVELYPAKNRTIEALSDRRERNRRMRATFLNDHQVCGLNEKKSDRASYMN